MNTALASSIALKTSGQSRIPTIQPVYDFPGWCQKSKVQDSYSNGAVLLSNVFRDAGLSGRLFINFSQTAYAPMQSADVRAVCVTERDSIQFKVNVRAGTGRVSTIMYARLEGIAASAAFAALKSAAEAATKSVPPGRIVSMGDAFKAAEASNPENLQTPAPVAPALLAGSDKPAPAESFLQEARPEEGDSSGEAHTSESAEDGRLTHFTNDKEQVDLLLLELYEMGFARRSFSDQNGGLGQTLSVALEKLVGFRPSIKSAGMIGGFLKRHDFLRNPRTKSMTPRERSHCLILSEKALERIGKEKPVVGVPFSRQLGLNKRLQTADAAPAPARQAPRPPTAPPPVAAVVRPPEPPAVLPAKGRPPSGDVMAKLAEKLEQFENAEGRVAKIEERLAAIAAEKEQLEAEKAGLKVILGNEDLRRLVDLVK